MSIINRKYTISSIRYFIIIWLVVLLQSYPLIGYSANCIPCGDSNEVSGLQLYTGDHALDVTLEFNFDEVFNSETDDEFPAMMTYSSSDEIEDIFRIKIKARGNTRRMKIVCDFPPLRINFKKSEVENTVFHGQNKLKLVTHCMDNNIYEGYTLQEYYIYKTYNLITDASLNVQLVKITYIDKSGKNKSIRRYGFFIEHKKQFAQRMNGEVLPKKIRTQESCDPASMNLFSVFQFMIGNTDWWVTTQHNVVLLVNETAALPIPIPYDFDYAGVINTPYSIPHETVPISSVRQRYYKGSCQPLESYDETVEQFIHTKEDIYELYRNSEFLKDSQKKSSLKYYDSFYKIINNPNSMRKCFFQNCTQDQARK